MKTKPTRRKAATPKPEYVNIRITKKAYEKISLLAKEERRTIVAFVDEMVAV